MHPFDLRLVILSAVIFVALACLIIVLLDIIDEGRKQRDLKTKLALYYSSHILTNLCFTLYFYNVPLLIWFNWMFMLNIVLVPVWLYAVIHQITTINPNDTFSKYHYVAPVLFAVAMLTLSIVTPVEEQLKTLTGNGTYVGGSYLFFIFSNKLIFRFLFNVVYIVLSFRRLSPYREFIINYSANESKSSLRWVTILFLFIITLIVFPLYGLFVSRSSLASSFITYFQVGGLVVQFSYLVFHILKRDYVLLDVAKPKETLNLEVEKCPTETKSFLKKNVLNKEQFEEYISTEKPYLKSDLKIIDLAEDFMVNRSYISSFINQEYAMNFSNYINQLRFDEYQQLRSNTKHSDKTNAELVEKAGFGSYRNYTRFVSKNAE